ncbi:ribbon-helix-helix domain-containing protein [Cylindrospermum sp. FACHB-282]|uniref:ribbon-helix-helix domain-containing protein n=1 Tax=Cylindrospermum sp. FACHB-282 TaxID=2692794 RepID=UPI00168289EB|nr:type II toxin-antitoxin system ParD family antitoxin [Cylindrospermum sp. FACHB-282]MBD2385415.1 type II toxin-antitoxin system ParD family antitoxin [Cylindrospermum sp. FACHB-282]
MSISLTPNQERFIQTKLQAGKYHSVEEVLEIALQLLDEYDRAETEWVRDVREKIDAAIAVSEQTAPIDGEIFVNQILERFEQQRQTEQ